MGAPYYWTHPTNVPHVVQLHHARSGDWTYHSAPCAGDGYGGERLACREYTTHQTPGGTWLCQQHRAQRGALLALRVEDLIDNDNRKRDAARLRRGLAAALGRFNA